MFKEARTNKTIKGNEWDEDNRSKFTKIDLTDFYENGLELKPTDVYVGQKDGKNFYQLIDEQTNQVVNVPSMDLDFFDSLSDEKLTELCNGKHTVISKEHTSKLSGRNYYELIIE